MKVTINGRRYDSARCEELGSKSHFNNGTYSGGTDLLRASDGRLLVHRYSNGQDLYLQPFLIPFEDFEAGIDYFEMDEAQEARCAELGLIEIV